MLKPDPGLLIWMCISFGILVFLLGKFAWKPILGAVKTREQSIADALNEAKKMRDDMAKMSASNEEIMRQARAERDLLLKDARDIRDKEISEAKTKAKAEADEAERRAKRAETAQQVLVAEARTAQSVAQHAASQAQDSAAALKLQEAGLAEELTRAENISADLARQRQVGLARAP